MLVVHLVDGLYGDGAEPNHDIAPTGRNVS